MLCSRFSFRLSVRQVVSRVILRGSALHYFAQRPIWAHKVDCLLTQHLADFLERGFLLAAEEKSAVAVARSNNNSYGLNYQKTGKELMSQDEIAVMDGAKCICY